MRKTSYAVDLPIHASVRGTPNRALIAATIAFFIGFGAVSLFGPTAQIFTKVMRLGPTELGFLVAIPMLTGSLLRIPFGAWVDTTGGKRPFLILLGCSVVGIAGLYYMLLTLYPNHLDQSAYPFLLLFGALGGCGIATFSVGIGQVSYWFPKRNQGWALAAYAGLGNTSPGLVTLLMPAMILFSGLWGAYLVSLLLVVVGIGLYLALGGVAPYFQFRREGLSPEDAETKARNAGQELFPQQSVMHALATGARAWRTWPLVLLYFTTFGGFLALTAWFPTYWQNLFHTSHWMALGITAGFSLFSSLIRVPGGGWSDRLGGERVAMLALGTLLVGALVMAFSSTLAPAIVGAALVAAGMGVNNAAVFRLVPTYVPHAVGGASGWVGGLGALGGFAVPPMLGYFVGIMGSDGYARGMLIYAALAVIGLALTATLQYSEPRRPAQFAHQP